MSIDITSYYLYNSDMKHNELIQEYPEDVRKIVRVMKYIEFLPADEEKAVEIWSEWSEAHAAGWLVVDSRADIVEAINMYKEGSVDYNSSISIANELEEIAERLSSIVSGMVQADMMKELVDEEEWVEPTIRTGSMNDVEWVFNIIKKMKDHPDPTREQAEAHVREWYFCTGEKKLPEEEEMISSIRGDFWWYEDEE